MSMFRNLKAEEVDVRVQSVTPTGGVILLMYIDARVCENLLDAAVGCMNWQRTHTRDNANCTVSIWCEDKKMWVSKEDTGAKSYSDADKGLASDSFKRACVNWGIGRELFTAPFIFIPAKFVKIEEKNGKQVVKSRFSVYHMNVEEIDGSKEITSLGIMVDDKKIWRWTKEKGASTSEKQEDTYTPNDTTVSQPPAASSVPPAPNASASNKRNRYTGAA